MTVTEEDTEGAGGFHGCEVLFSPEGFANNVSPVAKILRFDLWSCRETDVSRAMKRLAGAVSKDEKAAQHCSDFVSGQGTSVLVGVMSRWYKVPKIQALGCLVLRNVALRKSDTNHAVLLPVKETGALDTVLWAMLAYPSSLSVQLCACGFLSQALQVHKNAIYVVEHMDGLKVILKAQQRFPNNSGVQKWVHACIEVLLTCRELRGIFLDNRVREAVNEAIEISVRTADGSSNATATSSRKKRKY